MDDAQATNGVLSATSPSGQSQGANEQAALSGTGGQTSPSGQSAKDLENIQNLQRSLSLKDREAKQAQQTAQQLQQQMNALQQELRTMRYNSAPDDYARKELELADARAERDQALRYANQVTQTQQNDRDFEDAMKKIAPGFGLSDKELATAVRDAGATDWPAAIQVAADLQRNKAAQKQRDDDDKRERNQVDIGGGAPRTTQGQWEDDYDAAMRRGDTATIMRLHRTKGAT